MTVLGLGVRAREACDIMKPGHYSLATLETLHASCVSPTPTILLRASHLPFRFVRVDACCAGYSR